METLTVVLTEAQQHGSFHKGGLKKLSALFGKFEEGEAAELGDLGEGLDGDGLLDRDARRHDCITLDDHRGALSMRLLAILGLAQKLLDRALLRNGVHMQDGLVARCEDAFVLEQLEDVHVRVEDRDARAGVDGVAQDEALVHVIVIDPLELDANVLAWFRHVPLEHLLVLRRKGQEQGCGRGK